MAGITLAQAEAQLTAWLAASSAVAQKQSYTLPDGRTLTYADAKVIREQIDYWDQKVNQLSAGSRARVRRGAPIP